MPSRRILTTAALAAMVAVAGGCGSHPAASSRGQENDSKKAARLAGIPVGTVLRVGDQEQSMQTLFKASGEDKNLPYKLDFVEFDSGPLMDAGFAAKRIDAGGMGDTPATVSVSSHLPVRAISVNLPIGPSEFLLAKPGINSVAQLRGKPVAYTTGTSEQAFALRALHQAGLTQQNVRQVDVSLQQLGTVLQSGSADASVVSVQQKIDYQQTHPGAKVLATNITTKPPTYNYELATTAALGNPAKRKALEDFVRRMVKAAAWEKSHRSQWVTAYYVDVEHQSPSQAKAILAAGGERNYVPITPKVQSALQTVVQLMASAHAIKKPFSISPLFQSSVSRTFNSVIESAK